MKLHNSRNGLESNTKAMVSALLNARLADAIDLALSTKQAHWNLRGRQFVAVHEMLDGFGTAQIVVQASKLQAYPTDLVLVGDPMPALAGRYGVLAFTRQGSVVPGSP